MTGIFPDADKSSLSRTFSFHFRQQWGTWSATHKDGSLGMGEGHPNSHRPHPPPAAVKTAGKGVQSEGHMVDGVGFLLTFPTNTGE